MSALVDFLLARIGEDEDVAREAVEDWDWTLVELDGMAWECAQHVIRFDPARMLAECEAKRRIVEAYLELDAQIRQVALSEPDFANGVRMTRLGVGLALGALASVYGDHPDFDPAWGEL